MNKKYIICTCGPALSTTSQFINAYNLGCSNFRIPLSKMDRDNLGIIENICKVKKQLNIPISIILDLPTERLRIGKIEKKEFRKDETVCFCDPRDLVRIENVTSKSIVPVLNLFYHIDNLNIGDKILLKDGQIEFYITQKVQNHSAIFANCSQSSTICDAYSSFSIQGKSFKFKLLRSYDEELISMLLEKAILPQWMLLSFTNDVDDIKAIRAYFFERYKKRIKVMAKIENEMGLNNVQDIALEADGILIGRGDLCNNILPSDLPSAQKHIQNIANKSDCPVIVGTQFLQKFALTGDLSVTETVDIYSSICSSDGIMLSGESGGSPRSADCIAFLKEAIKKYTNVDTKGICL